MAIKRGVHFYSYMDKQFLGEFGLEECLKAAHDCGATGFEMLAEETNFGRFPNPTDDDVARWKDLLAKYEMEPISINGFIDPPRFRGEPDLSFSDCLKQQEDYLKLCQKLGFPILQPGVGYYRYNDLLEESISMAEYYGVKLGVCLSFALTANSTKGIDNFINMIERKNTKNLGFILDFAVFARKLSPSLIQQFLRNGADEFTINYILEELEKGERDLQEISYSVKLMRGRDPYTRLKSNITYMPSYYLSMTEYTRPENALASFVGPCGATIGLMKPDIIEYIKDYLLLCEGKFYDMTDDCVEPTVDFEGPINVLKKIGWDGYITSMYEGQRNYHDPLSAYSADEPAVVARHQKMLERLINA